MNVKLAYSLQPIEDVDLFSPHFFIRQDFLKYQSLVLNKDRIGIGIFSETEQSLLAYLLLAGKDGHWATPITGAFGGIAVKKGTPVDALETLLTELPAYLMTHTAVSSITTRLPPACFPDDSALIANILHRHGWALTQFDVNYHLSPTSMDRYMAELGGTKRRFIRRLEREGAAFQRLGKTALETVYSVIQKNRAAQGYPMTMSLEAITALVDAFSDEIQLFGVSLNTKIVAAAICIRINPHYLYVFYWGELPEFRSQSPVLLLARGIVEYCIKNNIDTMDIGTSSLDSVPNPGLCAFKASLGCQSSQKSTYVWRAQ